MTPEKGNSDSWPLPLTAWQRGWSDKEKERSLAEEQLLRLNEELEDRVEQRTEQLAGANHDLQNTLEDLQRTQKQLVLSEKLAALGELVAGVAHEINTPVGVALSAGSTLAEKNRTLAELFTQGEMKRSDLAQVSRRFPARAQR